MATNEIAIELNVNSQKALKGVNDIKKAVKEVEQSAKNTTIDPKVNTKAVDRLSTKVKALGKQFSGQLAQAAKVGGVAIAGALTGSVAAASKFESTMSNISTLGLPTEEVNGLADGIKNISKNSPTSPNELGAAAYDIVSAGISGTEDRLTALNASQKLAVVGLGDTAGATDLLTSSINAFGLDVGNSDQIANTLFKAVKNGKTTVDDLSQGFGQTAPAAAGLGVSFEELIATTAGMTTTGLSASDAYTQQRAVFTELQKPGAELAKVMKAAGIESGKASVESIGLSGTLEKLQVAANDSGKSFSQVFGGSEAANGALSITNTVGEAVAATMQDIKGGTDDLTAGFEKQKATTANQFKQLRNNVEVLAINLGEKLLPIVNKVITFFLENKTAAIAFGVGLGLLVIAVVALGIAMKVMAIQAAFAGASISIAFAPILIVIAVIAALIAIGILLYKNWDTIKAKAIEIFGALGGFIVTAFEAVKGAIGTAFEFIKNLFFASLPIIVGFFKLQFQLLKFIVVGVFNIIKTVLTVAWNVIKAIFLTTLSAIVAVVKFYFNVYKTVAVTIFNFIKTAITTAWNAIKNVFTTYLNLIKGIFTRVFNFYKSIVVSVFNFIKGSITSAWNVIKNVFTAAFNFIKTRLVNSFNFYKGHIVNILNFVKGFISRTWNTISASIRAALNIIKSVITTVFNAVRGVVTTVFNAIRSIATSVWNAILSVITTVANTIRSVVTSAFNAAKDAAVSAFNRLKDGAINALNALVSFVGTIGGKVLGALGDFGSLLFSKGADLIQGLLNGIKSLAGSVAGAVGDLVTSALDKIPGPVKSLIPGLAQGGSVQRFANGGVVKPLYRARGGSIFKPKGTDTVAAMLTPGEFVLRRSAVSKIGNRVAGMLNSGRPVEAAKAILARAGNSDIGNSDVGRVDRSSNNSNVDNSKSVSAPVTINNFSQAAERNAGFNVRNLIQNGIS